jgi:hypothetical protein
MKTSNKLLLGFFCLVVVNLVAANIAVKSEINKAPQSKNPLEISKTENSLLLINQNVVVLSINKNTTQEQLNDYQNKLKEANINLNIDKIEFGSDKKIKSLGISVDCNDGFKGSVNQTLTGGEKIGFYRIYSPKAPSPFGMYPMTIK